MQVEQVDVVGVEGGAARASTVRMFCGCCRPALSHQGSLPGRHQGVLVAMTQ